MAVERPQSVMGRRRPPVQRDPNALVASAALMTGPDASSAKIEVADWQRLAWEFYRTIGELRFGVNWLANAMSRVNLIAAKPPQNQGDEPTPIDVEAEPRLKAAVDLVNEIAGGVTGQGQLLAASARHLTVPGVGYILATADDLTDSFNSWRVLSNSEVQKPNGQDVIQFADPETGEWKDLAERDLLIKVWRSDPEKSWEPDSPVRAVLGSLAEIKLITQRIAADARSRLAGNGLLPLPMEAEFPPGQTTLPNGSKVDSFTETFLQVTTIPISDQSSPSATTPLIVKIPGEYLGKIQHVTFWSDFDMNLQPLREAAVKRVALGLDMPPEVLLGLGDSNHWSAWQIAEEAITLHVAPLAETICHALTMKFLRAALKSPDINIGPDEVIVWYDTSDLVTRPDLTATAREAYRDRAISLDSYLAHVGLDSTDKPTDDELRRRIVIDLALANPGVALELLDSIGIQIAAVISAGEEAEPVETPAGDEDTTGERTPPEREQEPADESATASAGLLAAADGLVERALEVAGQRLRNAASRKTAGGAAALSCDDPTRLHCTVKATEHASLDALLKGAWKRAGVIADRYAVDTESLTSCLDLYVRALIASGRAHTLDHLADVLGHTQAT